MPRAGPQGATGRRRLNDLLPGILLAAGGSTRFGRPKLLEEWRGEPLVRHSVRAFLEAGCTPLIAVVPADGTLTDALDGLELRLVVNPEPDLGIGHSIALGVGALPRRALAVVIGVADQPLLTAGVIRRLVEGFRPGLIVAARYGAQAGNPRVFDRRFFPELERLTGDHGAQGVSARHRDALVEVEFPEALGIDIDRPDDWSRLAASSQPPD